MSSVGSWRRGTPVEPASARVSSAHQAAAPSRPPIPVTSVMPGVKDKSMNAALNVLVGKDVILRTMDGEEFEGLFSSTEPGAVMLRFAKLKKGDLSALGDCADVRGNVAALVSIPVARVSSIIANQPFTERDLKVVPDIAQGSATSGFATDTEISFGTYKSYGRRLQRFSDFSTTGPSGSEPSDADTFGEDMVSSAPMQWNQFEENERLYGVTTSFDEEEYTTKIDRADPKYAERRANAARLAAEIEGRESSNSHVREERGFSVSANDGDEEDRFSGVRRPHAPPKPLSYAAAASANGTKSLGSRVSSVSISSSVVGKKEPALGPVPPQPGKTDGVCEEIPARSAGKFAEKGQRRNSDVKAIQSEKVKVTGKEDGSSKPPEAIRIGKEASLHAKVPVKDETKVGASSESAGVVSSKSSKTDTGTSEERSLEPIMSQTSLSGKPDRVAKAAEAVRDIKATPQPAKAAPGVALPDLTNADTKAEGVKSSMAAPVEVPPKAGTTAGTRAPAKRSSKSFKLNPDAPSFSLNPEAPMFVPKSSPSQSMTASRTPAPVMAQPVVPDMSGAYVEAPMYASGYMQGYGMPPNMTYGHGQYQQVGMPMSYNMPQSMAPGIGPGMVPNVPAAPAGYTSVHRQGYPVAYQPGLATSVPSGIPPGMHGNMPPNIPGAVPGSAFGVSPAPYGMPVSPQVPAVVGQPQHPGVYMQANSYPYSPGIRQHGAPGPQPLRSGNPYGSGVSPHGRTGVGGGGRNRRGGRGGHPRSPHSAHHTMSSQVSHVSPAASPKAMPQSRQSSTAPSPMQTPATLGETNFCGPPAKHEPSS